MRVYFLLGFLCIPPNPASCGLLTYRSDCDLACQILHPAACGIPMGSSLYYPSASNCLAANCPPVEGCCLENTASTVACRNLTPEYCEELGGWSMGPGSSCPASGCFSPGDPEGGGGEGGGGGRGNDELPVELYGEYEVPPQQQIVERGEGLPPGEIYADREYVYGPDYVDEFIAQFDREGHAIFMLQDGNYNVVALVAGDDLPDGNGGTIQPGTVLQQYTYEPYGTLIAVETLEASPQGPPLFPVNRVGHQGLFFDRFGGRYEQYSLIVRESEAGPDFATGAKGLYYNRNRFYSPSLGRFTSRDPNETALPIITAMATNGQALNVAPGSLDLSGTYHDGQNLYIYECNRPNLRQDPLGLMSALELAFTQGEGNVLEDAQLAGLAVARSFAHRMLAKILTWSFNYSVRMIYAATAGSVTLGLDPSVWPQIADEYTRFNQFTARNPQLRYQFEKNLQNANLDPNKWDPWGGWRQFRKVMDDHAYQWFGVPKGTVLTNNQIREWGKLIEYTARSTHTFNWTFYGRQTVGHLIKYQGKDFCVFFCQKTGELVSAFIPSAAEKAAMLQLLGL